MVLLVFNWATGRRFDATLRMRLLAFSIVDLETTVYRYGSRTSLTPAHTTTSSALTETS